LAETQELKKSTATPDDVYKIIGVARWVGVICDECGKDCNAIVLVGQGDESVGVCETCISTAAQMFAEQTTRDSDA
jgi:hypothetical protein